MAGLFEQRDLMTPQAQQRAIEAGIARPEDFVGGRPAKVAPTGPLYKSGSSAEEDAAKARGITIIQKRAEADAQLQELLKKRKAAGYAGGGMISINPKKPLDLTVTPHDVAIGKAVDEWQRQQADQAYNESRQRMIDARRRQDATAALTSRPTSEYSMSAGKGTTADQRAKGFVQRLEKGMVAGQAIPLMAAGMGAMAPGMLAAPTSLLGKLVQGAIGGGLGTLSDEDPTVAGLMSINPIGLAAQTLYGMYGDDTPMAPIREAKAKGYAGGGKIGALGRIARHLSGEGEPIKRGVMDIVKEKGGQWLSGSGSRLRSSVEDALAPELRNVDVPRIAAALRTAGTPEQTLNNSRAMDKWIKGALTNYIKRDMGTEGDPIRALAEQGILHVKPEQLNVAYQNAMDFPLPGQNIVGKSPLARTWETASDLTIGKSKAKDLLPPEFTFNPRFDEHGQWHTDGPQGAVKEMAPDQWENNAVGNNGEHGTGNWLNYVNGERTEEAFSHPARAIENAQEQLNPTWAQNKWLSKVDPEQDVHSISGDEQYFTGDVGFDHMLDELGNALDPDSGLPPHLRITPDQLKSGNFSVDGAVRHVAKINDWREAQKIEANKVRANNAATHLHKDYGDGYKWVQLKKPEAKHAEGYDGMSLAEREASDRTSEQSERGLLQDALKYEGDTMKHCVGGYCDDVADGRSNIFSLRDAKGQPHVTVEVIPPGKLVPITDEMRAERGYLRPHDKFMDLDTGYGHVNDQVHPKIQQIKGKGNKAPIADYLPYVQDFVKSGKWSDVGDLQNTGLVRRADGAFEVDTPEGAKFRQDALDELHADDNNFAKGGLIDFHALHGYN